MIIPATLRRPFALGALWAGVLLLAFDAWSALDLAARPAVSNDFRLLYLAGRLALGQGWPSLYDFAAQRAEASALGFFWQPFLNPPPLVALGLPLTALPFPVATALWTLLLAAALAGAVALAGYGTALERTAQLLLVAGLFPVAFGIMVGQPGALVTAALAASWWLLRGGRWAAAGAVLALIALKPQLGFLVPFALVAAGRWRPGLLALGLLGLLAAVSAALLDGGLGAYLSGLREASGWELTRRYAAGGLFPAPWSALVEAAAALAGLAAARRLRARLEAVFAAGIAASLLATPYIGIQDLVALALAALLILRIRPPAWQAALVLLGYPLAELALALGPAPLLLWRLAWLGSLLVLRAAEPSDQLDRPIGARVGATPPA